MSSIYFERHGTYRVAVLRNSNIRKLLTNTRCKYTFVLQKMSLLSSYEQRHLVNLGIKLIFIYILYETLQHTNEVHLACPEMEEYSGWWADQKHVFEENSGNWGSLTRKREEWTRGLIQIFERPSYGQANKSAGCSPGQNKAGSNGEERVFYSKTDLVLIPPLTE